MSGQHRPGEHSREIDIKALRAWMAAGRPGTGPRDWRYRLHSRTGPNPIPPMREPWAFWNVLAIVLVVLFGAAMVAVVKVLVTDLPTVGVARWI